MDRYEVSALVAVLEDHRGLAVLDAALEDSRDPGVRVVQALSGSVDVEEAQRDGGDAVRPSRDQTQLLLVPFGGRVHAVRLARLRLRRRDGREARPAGWAVRPPVLPRELRRVPERRCKRTVGRAGVRAFAVDRHRGGDEELLHAMLPFDEGLEKPGRPADVRIDVAGDLVHALSDTHHRGEMHDDLDVAEGAVKEVRISDVLEGVVRFRVQVVRLRFVNLRFQIVDDVHPVTLGDERVDEVTADEARTARDEDPFRHVLFLAICSRNESMVRRSPSSRETLGSHPNTVRAFRMSGQRTFGSSGGSGLWAMPTRPPAIFCPTPPRSFSAPSSGLPKFTGPSPPPALRRRPTPSTRSSP